MDRPLILLTNDDGVDSPHLELLRRYLEESLDAELLVMAPERERSAMSHSITLHKPLRVEERTPNTWAVSGSPVDCVYVGVMKLASRRPSLVVSGPNNGFNLGTDVFYSGTVGAAMEGALRGIPSIAVSVDRQAESAVEEAARLVASLAARLLAQPEAAPVAFNINVPNDSRRRHRFTILGKRSYADDVHVRQDPRGRNYYWIGGGVAGIEDIPGSDCEAVYQGISSITPLGLDLTHRGVLEGNELVDGLDGFERA